MTGTADQRTTIVLTGFGPFPGIADNESARLVRRLAKRARLALPAHRIASAVLPTEWQRAPRQLAGLYRRHQPALALHFGVAHETSGFRIETEAANLCRSAPDAAGAMPPSLTLAADEAVRPVSIDALALAAALQALGYPVSLSDNAGGYLCNAVLFHSLRLAAESQCRVGFIHIPASLSPPLMPLESAVSGSLEIIKFALASVGPGDR